MSDHKEKNIPAQTPSCKDHAVFDEMIRILANNLVKEGVLDSSDDVRKKMNKDGTFDDPQVQCLYTMIQFREMANLVCILYSKVMFPGIDNANLTKDLHLSELGRWLTDFVLSTAHLIETLAMKSIDSIDTPRTAIN